MLLLSLPPKSRKTSLMQDVAFSTLWDNILATGLLGNVSVLSQRSYRVAADRHLGVVIANFGVPKFYVGNCLLSNSGSLEFGAKILHAPNGSKEVSCWDTPFNLDKTAEVFDYFEHDMFSTLGFFINPNEKPYPIVDRIKIDNCFSTVGDLSGIRTFGEMVEQVNNGHCHVFWIRSGSKFVQLKYALVDNNTPIQGFILTPRDSSCKTFVLLGFLYGFGDKYLVALNHSALGNFHFQGLPYIGISEGGAFEPTAYLDERVESVYLPVSFNLYNYDRHVYDTILNTNRCFIDSLLSMMHTSDGAALSGGLSSEVLNLMAKYNRNECVCGYTPTKKDSLEEQINTGYLVGNLLWQPDNTFAAFTTRNSPESRDASYVLFDNRFTNGNAVQFDRLSRTFTPLISPYINSSTAVPDRFTTLSGGTSRAFGATRRAGSIV